MKAKVSGTHGSKRGRREQATDQLTEFVKGQIWKTPDAYIQITEVGKLLIHYRFGNRPDVQSKPRISSKQDVQSYLGGHGGVLFKTEG